MAGPRFIKICGLRTPAEALAASAAGATAFGVLVGLTHRAADEIDVASARAIGAALPDGAELVVVTHLTDPAAVAGLADRIGAATIQVHGDMSPEGLDALRRMVPGRRLLKAVHVSAAARHTTVGETADKPGSPAESALADREPDAVAIARRYVPHADALLLDSRTANRLGGTGRTHDWTISRRIVAAVAPLPVYLAGGLNPGNVAAAVAAVRPAGVDVNSGVEDPTSAKDPIRLRAFVAAARQALG